MKIIFNVEEIKEKHYFENENLYQFQKLLYTCILNLYLCIIWFIPV